MDRIPPTATAGAPFVVDGGRWDRNPSLRLSRTGRIAVPGRTLNVADRALHLRCRVLGNIRFDASRSGRVLPPAGACYRHGFAAIARFLRATSSGNVSISLQNLLRSDLRVFFEETGVVKDWLEILGYLRKVNTCELKKRFYTLLTSDKVSLYAISALTASIERKLSSTVLFFALGYRIFGVMTVARLWMSILLPDSSSTCEKDEAQLRKANRTSIVSR